MVNVVSAGDCDGDDGVGDAVDAYVMYALVGLVEAVATTMTATIMMI